MRNHSGLNAALGKASGHIYFERKTPKLRLDKVDGLDILLTLNLSLLNSR